MLNYLNGNPTMPAEVSWNTYKYGFENVTTILLELSADIEKSKNWNNPDYPNDGAHTV